MLLVTSPRIYKAINTAHEPLASSDSLEQGGALFGRQNCRGRCDKIEIMSNINYRVLFMICNMGTQNSFIFMAQLNCTLHCPHVVVPMSSNIYVGRPFKSSGSENMYVAY